MRSCEVEEVIVAFVKKFGEHELTKLLKSKIDDASDENDVLTIIANQALHKIPDKYLHGVVYVASKGNMNFINGSDLKDEIINILRPLKDKLIEKPWKRVYLIPTGHPIIALQIKNLVYHILRLDTIDLCYLQGHYSEIEIKRASLL